MKRRLTIIIMLLFTGVWSALALVVSPSASALPAQASEQVAAQASEQVPAQAVGQVAAQASEQAPTLVTSQVPPQSGFGNFIYKNSYTASLFRDVRETDWYAPYVRDAYNYGLMRGNTANTFDPGGRMTLGEAVTLAARVRSIYYTGDDNFPVTVPSYAAYADYALLHGIIGSHGNYNAQVSRGMFAELMCKALPLEVLSPINEIPDFGICDIPLYTSAGEAVYTLYRAGVLCGADRYGTFSAGAYITRAEISAILVRMVFPAARVSMLLPTHISADVIFQRCADAVFMLETFDAKGALIRTGSGFFISDTGLAVTNLHVLENADSAKVTMYNGDIFRVKGFNAVSAENNLVIFSVDSNRSSGWSYLMLADSDAITAGNTVYALGSPRALMNTMSEGIISYSRRELEWETLIQFTAPISFGSGGSPLLNTLGQVVGLASSSYTYGQNLNLAVPINYVKEMQPGRLIALADLPGR